jgi:hypothetical protein
MSKVCRNCGGKDFNLIASNIVGMDKVIDIFICRKCHYSLEVSTVKDTNPDFFLNDDVDVPDPDFDDVEIFEEDPYEDDDGGWDPSIG